MKLSSFESDRENSPLDSIKWLTRRDKSTSIISYTKSMSTKISRTKQLAKLGLIVKPILVCENGRAVKKKIAFSR